MRRPVISRVQSTLLCIARPRTWCGVACFNLSELLNPRLVEAAVLQGLPPAPESALQRLVHPLPLRADVEPQRASLKKLLQVAETVLVNRADRDCDIQQVESSEL